MDTWITRFKQLPLVTRRIIVITTSLLFALIIIATSDFYDIVDLNILERGYEAKSIVEKEGGTVEVRNFNSPIHKLSVDIPSDSFLNPIEFTIRMESVEGEDMGDKINPITPLIIIDNEGYFSQKTITVSIPIDIDTETELAQAFFYYENTGILEAIPTAALHDDEIVITTMHFSSIVVSKITYDELDQLVADEKEVDSGFLPGVDDWQFVNFGSSITPNGNCAGQTLTSAYYYVTRTKKGEPNLWGLFDNETPDFWLDDVLPYRFVSVVQNEMDFTSEQYINFLEYSMESSTRSYYQFLYAMYLTENPQFVTIYSHQGGVIVSGHAILVYKVTKDKLYVSDPNFPGATDRYISYDGTNGFGPYSSGDNARDIDESGVLEYDTFAFVGLSAMVNFDFIEIQYERMQVGRVGDYHFPNLELDYMEKYFISHDDINWIPIDGNFQLPIDYNVNVLEEQLGKVIISGRTEAKFVRYTIFKDHRPFISDVSPDATGYFFATLPLVSGTQHFGVLVETIQNGRLHYADYIPFSYTYYGETYVPEDKEEAIVGRYFYVEETSQPSERMEHFIQIRTNGEFIDSYLENDEVVEVTGTWELEEINGDYQVRLVYSTTVTTFQITEDFQTIYIQNQEYYTK